MGFQYENQAGGIGWHTTSWSNEKPELIHDDWVAGSAFHSVRIHYFYQGNNTRIEIFGPITGVVAAERSAVLKALEEPEAA